MNVISIFSIPVIGFSLFVKFGMNHSNTSTTLENWSNSLTLDGGNVLTIFLTLRSTGFIPFGEIVNSKQIHLIGGSTSLCVPNLDVYVFHSIPHRLL